MTNKDLEERLEAVEYWVCRTAKLTPEGLALLRSNDKSRWKAQTRQQQEKEATQAKERKRKEQIVERYKQNPPKCPECGSKGEFIEAQGPTANFWTGPPGDYWAVEFRCLNQEEHHRHRWRVFPDAPKEDTISIDPKDIVIAKEEEET